MSGGHARYVIVDAVALVGPGLLLGVGDEEEACCRRVAGWSAADRLSSRCGGGRPSGGGRGGAGPPA